MKSLDPRVNRLPSDDSSVAKPKEPLDQLATFEVFLKKSEKRLMEHVGIVHGADEEIAFLFAKEQFSRRYTCIEMWIVKSSNTFATGYTEADVSVYDSIKHIDGVANEEYCIFHLLRRGKQHVFAGTVEAESVEHALSKAKKSLGDTQVFNIWVVKSSDLHKWSQKELWETLPDKGFRDALAYRAGDKLKDYLNERKNG